MLNHLNVFSGFTTKEYTFFFGGVLSLILAWHFPAFTGLIFLGFSPLLFLLNEKELNFKKSFLLSYLFILFWQLGSSFWLFRTHVFNVSVINILNSILPALIIAGAFQLKFLNKGRLPTYTAITLAWLSMEFGHHHWELAYPLLTLGNALGDWPVLIQWYEWTGVLGGTLWIWVMNFIFLELFMAWKAKAAFPLAQGIKILAAFGLPLALSLFLLPGKATDSRMVNVVSLHPDLDCYNEKYLLSIDTLVDQYLAESLTQVNENTDYLVWPETAVPDGGWSETIAQDPLWLRIQDSLQRFPKLQLVTGTVLFDPVRDPAEQKSPLVRYDEASKLYYKTRNAALQLQAGQAPQIRTKQQLVAFEETLPYPNTLGFLSGWVTSLGKFAFSAGNQDKPLFRSETGGVVTPLICYESAFGESTGRYVREGAQLLMVILNEGWYQSRFGAHQFMRLSRLRAIETRRGIARSSNFGASGFIDPSGQVLAMMDDFSPMALQASLPVQSQLTWYVRYGDFLGRIAVWGLLGLMIWTGIQYPRQKKIQRNISRPKATKRKAKKEKRSTTTSS